MEQRTTYEAPSSDAPLLGHQAGFANDVSDRLSRLHVPSNASRLLERVRRRTFGDAGFAQKRHEAEPGMWCDFDLAEWAREMAWDKSNLRRSLQWLVKHRILHAQGGRIGWNRCLGEWQASNQGGKREGAGAKAGHPNYHLPHARIIQLDHAINQNDHGQEGAELFNLTTIINQNDHDEAPSLRMNPAQNGHGRMEEPEETSPNGDAHVASDAVTAPPKSKRKRALDPEEQKYVRLCVEALMAATKVSKLPSMPQERDAAHWFWNAGPEGTPVPIETIMALYRKMKADTFWHGKFLSLRHLKAPYVACNGDIATYQTSPSKSASRAAPKQQTPVYADAADYRL